MARLHVKLATHALYSGVSLLHLLPQLRRTLLAESDADQLAYRLHCPRRHLPRLLLRVVQRYWQLDYQSNDHQCDYATH